jgi:agmatine/peptidylarginine deiminase
MRTRTRILLILELLLGVVPVTALYIYYFPAGLFWTRQVLAQAIGGVVNAFTASIAAVFIAGGIGLVSAWFLMAGRLFGRGFPGRLPLAGLLIGMAASIGILIVTSIMGAFWIDYYLYGAPLLVAAHHVYAGMRSGGRASHRAVVAIVVFMVTASVATTADAAGQRRVAAEWEPALGALVGWPPVVPDELLVEIAKDDRLFLVVDDAGAQTEAEDALQELGIDLAAVEFITTGPGFGLPWPRDWGPHALFDEEGVFHLADPKFVGYPVATPSCEGRLYSEGLFSLFSGDSDSEDAATDVVAGTLGLSRRQLPFALTGGNALVDGHGTAFSTCVMLNENRRHLGISQDEFHRAVETHLGISNHVIVPNFEWFGIQHIDCLMKPLNEETLLVKRVPEGHPDHESIEEIVDDLSALTGPYGRPYRILRIDTPPYLLGYFVANYTNSLILNRKVLVPLFDIPADEAALETFREAMPGYEVIGFKNGGRDGWSWLDALHCRVRAIWDPEMLYMSHRRIDDKVEPAASYRVEALIRDHSRAGLIDEELELSWRLRGETDWHQVPLTNGSEPDMYAAVIPGPDAGSTVEYFLAAADRSGRREALPRVAPDGFYSFSVDSHTE